MQYILKGYTFRSIVFKIELPLGYKNKIIKSNGKFQHLPFIVASFRRFKLHSNAEVCSSVTMHVTWRQRTFPGMISLKAFHILCVYMITWKAEHLLFNANLLLICISQGKYS